MPGSNGGDPQRQIEAGEVEKVKASEEVVKRNIVSMMQHGNVTRKAVIELKTLFDALQANVMAQGEQLKQMRLQLASLQQEFYRRGTTSYSDEPVPEEAEEAAPDNTEGVAGQRIQHP